MRILVTGGVKSGKSSFALEAARRFPEPRSFLATAEPFDDEMRQRIARHREERLGAFDTIEEPLEIDTALRSSMVVDCLTMWVNNVFFRGAEDRFDAILSRFIANLPADTVIVTNEVGLGNIPADPLSRRYNLALAKANREVAAACDTVVLMVAGIPLVVKGSLP